MNAVIACGGTGGHLFPGIAVAEVLRDRGHEVMLLISEKDIDALPLSLPRIQTSGSSGHGWIHFHGSRVGGTNTRHCHLYSRIKRRPRKGEPIDGAHRARGDARLQGMRAFLSKNTHRSHRHTGPERASALGSTCRASKTRTG